MSFGAANPGRGRRTRIPNAFETQATRELLNTLGEPTRRTLRGATLLTWEVNKAGEGAICARLSGEDMKKGETAMGQVHGLRELVQRENLNARYVVVALRTSGVPDFDDRPDFQFLRERVEAGSISWVAYRHPDRIARHTLPAESFYRFLERAAVDLYLTVPIGRKVDWIADRAILLMLGFASEQERNQIVFRIHDALRRRWLEEGRGWAASQPFGFRRDEFKFLEVDPDRWVFVEMVHHDYARLARQGTGGLRRLQGRLAEAGCKLSVEKIRQILRNPIYVTGEWSATYRGQVYPGRTIDLERPVPREVFDENAALLDSIKGHHSVTPFGTFLLNNVQVVHASCMGERTDTGSHILLRAKRRSGRPLSKASYRHTPYSPPSCRGCAVLATALDDAVITQLLRLAESPELQALWAARARPEAEQSTANPEAQLASLRTRVRALGEQRGELKRRWLDSVAAGDLRINTLAEGLDTIDHEVATLAARIEFLEQLAAARGGKHHRSTDDLLAAMRDLLYVHDADDTSMLARRAAFVSAVLSRVIVHDVDGGFAVELEGPLIPPDAPFVPVNPALALEGRLSTNGAIGGQSGLVPAWRSTIEPVDGRPYRCGFVSLARLREVIRLVHEAAPDGPLFEHGGAYAQMAKVRPWYPGLTTLFIVAKRHRTTPTRLLFSMYGKDAIRKQRMDSYDTDEMLLTCLAMALEAGFAFGPGWTRRYADLRETHQHLPSGSAVWSRAHRLGISTEALFERAAAFRDSERGSVSSTAVTRGTSTDRSAASDPGHLDETRSTGYASPDAGAGGV